VSYKVLVKFFELIYFKDFFQNILTDEVFMTTQTQLTPQLLAAQYFQGIQALYPLLPEPHNGAIRYAVNVTANPTVDEEVCKEAGKVVLVAAKLSQKIDYPVTIRGSFGPLSWESDRSADQQTMMNLSEKTFTFHIPPNHMNDKIEFKLCIPPTNVNDKIRWSTGNNWSIDLSRYGHIVEVYVTNVLFS
jgi:hypothetical protein